MREPLDAADAIIELIHDSRTSRSSRTSLKRVQRACQSLGLTGEQTRLIEAALDYRMSASSDLYDYYRTARTAAARQED